MNDYSPLPKKPHRITGQKYMYNNDIVIWNGTKILCEHNRQRSVCKECGGGSICEHNRLRCYCKECGGSQICEHNRERRKCIECGGSGICEHNKRKERCIECGGSQICEHNKRRENCKECDPNGYLIKIIRDRVRGALKSYSTRKDKKHTFEYVGSLEDVITHLENQFENEAERCGHPISWENQGEWHIDHIRPCASFNLDLEEEKHKCFHYTNLQPMWGPDNISKSDTYDEDEDEREWDGDKWIKK